MSDHAPFAYSRIDENVFIGTNACCQMHYDQMLTAHGITCDISLEGERIDRPFGAELFLWLPTPDHRAPERRKVDIGIASLESMIANGCRIFLHCKNGHGRAPTFYASYLIKKKGLTPYAAIDWIKRARPAIHLEPEQLGFLQSLTQSS
jgi:dual specificity MAP kinase phosphatase